MFSSLARLCRFPPTGLQEDVDSRRHLSATELYSCVNKHVYRYNSNKERYIGFRQPFGCKYTDKMLEILQKWEVMIVIS